MLRAGVVLGGLVWRDVRRHQHHQIQAQGIARMARDREMPEVRRVERPTEDADRSRIVKRRRPVRIHDVRVTIEGILKPERARPPR